MNFFSVSLKNVVVILLPRESRSEHNGTDLTSLFKVGIRPKPVTSDGERVYSGTEQKRAY